MPAVEMVIGIAGGSGSGKSTLVKQIRSSSFGSQIAYLAHDDYYRDIDLLPQDLRDTSNWDHPDALENDRFVADLDALRQGATIEAPLYDFATHHRKLKTRTVEPKRILLIEGILLFAIPTIAERIDLRVYVQTPAEERLVRRLLRDNEERNRPFTSVLEQYRHSVRPMHDQFVEPSRLHAHVIIPWDWQADTKPALEMLLAWFAYHHQ